MLAGRQQEIHAERDRKLKEASMAKFLENYGRGEKTAADSSAAGCVKKEKANLR